MQGNLEPSTDHALYPFLMSVTPHKIPYYMYFLGSPLKNLLAQAKPQPKDQMRVVLPFKLTAICRPKRACLT